MSQDPTHDEGLLYEGAATDRGRTVIISDTHLAGGPDDPLEDHVWRNRPLARFIEGLTTSEEGKKGDIELIINGDFLEFVQAAPEVYTPNDSDLWCSEPESLLKLQAILNGHEAVFKALKALQEAGNAVTLMAGNHDIDFYWPKVRKRLRDAAGPVRFELGREWYTRYGGRLHIAHGHQIDPANRFSNWHDPITFGSGQARLENCDGTRFVVGFVNPMDARYPFVDNIKPFGRLAKVLLREDKLGGIWASLLLMRYMAKARSALLGVDSGAADPMEKIRDTVRNDSGFADALLPIYRELVDPSSDREQMRSALRRSKNIQALMESALDAGRLHELPPLPAVAVSSAGRAHPGGPPAAAGLPGRGHGNSIEGEGAVLGLAQEMATDVGEDLRTAAEERHALGAQVIVCGHTHLPDRFPEAENTGTSDDKYVYFNTGSWTRYLRPGKEDTVTLAQLQDGERFPYELYACHVSDGGDGKLRAHQELFEKG